MKIRSVSSRLRRLPTSRPTGTSKAEGEAGHELDRRFEVARTVATKRNMGELSWLDPRRVRLFPHGLHAHGDCERIRNRREGRLTGRVPYSCRAPYRRLRLRVARRAFR